MYKVCFVDDEVMNHQLFEKLIDWKEHGFEIAGCATDGLEALNLYEEKHPDLIFMDIQMPMMDGLECLRCIRQDDAKVQVVIVSAFGEFSYAQKAIQYGVLDFLLKPVSRIMLRQVVDKAKAKLDEMDELEAQIELAKEFEDIVHPFYTSGGTGADIYVEYEIDSHGWDEMILNALANGDESMILEYMKELFGEAARKMLQPKLLQTATIDYLIQMKFCLKKLDEEKSFELLRHVRLEQIYDAATDQELFEFFENKVREVFAEYGKRMDSRDTKTMLVLQANAIAELNFMDADFSVQDVVEQVGISKNYFVSVYKEKTGIGYWDYVTELRMKHAKEMLLTKNDTVSAIAEQCGYQNEYYFSRKFKEYFGESPREFRGNRNIL